MQRDGALCYVTKASCTWERAGTRRRLCASDEGRRGASTGKELARDLNTSPTGPFNDKSILFIILQYQ
jgi:hypothetical protein